MDQRQDQERPWVVRLIDVQELKHGLECQQEAQLLGEVQELPLDLQYLREELDPDRYALSEFFRYFARIGSRDPEA
jgi:hypothetical protein